MFFYSLNAYCMYVYYLIHVCCIFCGAIKKKEKKKEKKRIGVLYNENILCGVK